MAKILIVEYEHTLNEAYQLILASTDHQIKAAYDGLEALKITKKYEPDLILLDLRMPRLSGIEFLKKFDPTNKHPKTKIIIFSNLDMEAEIDQAYNLGAHKYILKAWASPKELLQVIDDVLAQTNNVN